MLHLVHNLSPSESLQSLVHTGVGISSIIFVSLADLINFLSLFPPCSLSFCPFALHVSLADSYHASLVWSCLSARAIHSGFAHHITQASFEVHAEQWLWNLDPHEVTWASTMCLILQFRSIKYSCTFNFMNFCVAGQRSLNRTIQGSACLLGRWTLRFMHQSVSWCQAQPRSLVGEPYRMVPP